MLYFDGVLGLLLFCLWLIAGRPQAAASRGRGLPYRGNTGASAFPEYERPGRFAATDPEDDEAFLRQVRERAEEQRRQHREKQRRDDADGS